MRALVVTKCGRRFVIHGTTLQDIKQQIENTRRFDRFIEKPLTIKTIQDIRKP